MKMGKVLRSALLLLLAAALCLSMAACTQTPAEWHGLRVPDILLSGDHAKVARWRRKQSILRTRERRPDLYAALRLDSKEDKKILREIADEDEDRAAAQLDRRE